jgi:hypothetical protein
LALTGRTFFHHGSPLNVRELEQAMRLALINQGVGRIELRHLPGALGRAGCPVEAPQAAETVDRRLTSEELEHRLEFKLV